MKAYRSYIENDILWIPVSQIAREYHKNPWTIVRWIRDGFAAELGFVIKRDVSGRWLLGKPLPPRTPHGL